jgi:cobalt-zinc-cadmium efflux system outer membrane protein
MNRYRTWIMLIMTFCFIAPAQADYDTLSRDLDNYTPPPFFTPLAKEDPKEAGEDADTRAAGQAEDLITGLKSGYEKQAAKDRSADFLSKSTAGLLPDMADTAADPEKTQTVVAHAIRPDELEILAAFRNPAIQAAQKKVKAELESFTQVLELDDNLKQYTAFTKAINNRTGPLKMKDSIKQQFPFPGTTSLKGRIVQQQAAVAIEEMKITQRDIITQARNTYWDLVFNRQSFDVTFETIEALHRLKDVATSLYRSGRTSFQDIIKINIRIEVLKEERNTLASQKLSIHARIKELLDLPVNTDLGESVFTSPPRNVMDLDRLYALARQHRQELKVIRFQIAKVENMIEMAESMIHSPATLNLSLFENEAVNTVGSGALKPSFPEKTMAGMQNGSPVKPWYGIDNSWLNQTRQNLLSMKQMLTKKENETDRMVRDAWFMLDKNRRELTLFKETVLPMTRSALDVATREYESGTIPFSQAIGSYTDWLNAKLAVAKKQSGLGKSFANLEKTIGTRFDSKDLKGI